MTQISFIGRAGFVTIWVTQRLRSIWPDGWTCHLTNAACWKTVTSFPLTLHAIFRQTIGRTLYAMPKRTNGSCTRWNVEDPTMSLHGRPRRGTNIHQYQTTFNLFINWFRKFPKRNQWINPILMMKICQKRQARHWVYGPTTGQFTPTG